MTIEDKICFEASSLSDQGFGDFNRCYMILKNSKGDVEKAKAVLSKLIFREGKGEWDNS